MNQYFGRIMEEFAKGGFAGAFAVTMSYPIDTVKTRIQTNPKYHFLNDLKVLRNNNNGSIVRGLYRGVSAPLVAVCLEKSVLFSAFNHIKFFHTDNEHINNYVNGVAAGFLSTFVVTPFERVKIQMQDRQTSFVV